MTEPSLQHVLVCGGAGGRTDPLRLRRDDLSRTTGDALLASLSRRLSLRLRQVSARLSALLSQN